ncbi:MAG: S41 family peptidase, partial [bacterium]|nr:S41 family peptidase [bacterium]
MKNLLLRISFLFLFFILQSQSVFGFYSDVNIDHPYYSHIKTLYDQGHLDQDDEIFRPDDKLKLSELYELILNYSNYTLSSEINLPYVDTSNDSDYAPYIQTAIDLKILLPFGVNPELNPNKTVSKHRALSNIFKSFGIGNKYIYDKEDFPFTDLNPNSLTASIAARAAELGIFEDTANLFKMSKRITRGEAAYYLYKINNQPQTFTFTITPTLNSSGEELPDAENFSTFLDVWSSLKNDYLYKDELNGEELIFGAIKGMLTNVSDKYTVFEEPVDAEDLLSTLSGDYEGIGIIIEIIDKNITIVSPFSGSPAEQAGLKANDIIIEVDNENVIGNTLSEVASKIKGPSGTEVLIKVLRDLTEQSFTVARNFILLTTVNGKTLTSENKNIGYIQIVNFGEDTYEELIQTITDLVENSPDGFIIDLRNNPGGFLDVAVNIFGLFSEEIITAVKLEYGDGHIEEYKTNGNGLLRNYQIVVLINEGSASAS